MNWRHKRVHEDRRRAVGRSHLHRILAVGALILAIVPGQSACAALSVEFDIQPRVIHVGEVAVCGLTVRGVENPPAPAFPQIPGFQISMAGTERSISIGTGGADNATTFRFRLVPIQAGKFSIGPFAYTAGGETANLPAIVMEVVPPGTDPAQAAGTQQISDLLFVDLSTPATNVFNQQVFDLTLSVYSRGLNLGPEIGLMNMPASGLSVQPFQEVGSSREVVSNQVYDVRRFRAKATALTAGMFRFAPTIRLALRIPRQRRNDPFFGDSVFGDFFGRYETQNIDVQPVPMTLEVTPLPTEGQPVDFSGAVGQFSFLAQVKPTEVHAGDPVTVSMQITGNGNIESVTPPETGAGDGFKVYEARLISKDVDPGQAVGRKVFEQVLIPRRTEVTAIPALRFSFFDPGSASYKTIVQGPFPLKVDAASNAMAKVVQAQSSPSGEPTVLLGSDIVYLKPAPGRWRHSTEKPWYRTTPFLLLQVVPAFLLAVLFAGMHRRNVLERDVAKARRYQAPRSARAAVRRAETALTAGNRADFFEATSEALASYFGHRLNLAPGEVTAERVIQALHPGLTSDELNAVESLFRRCEQERFGLGSSPTGSPGMTEEWTGILNGLQSILKTCERVRL